MISSALASTIIPIADRVIVDIGSVPQWFISVAAGFIVYKVWKAEKHSALSLEKIEQVRHETNSMRSALELASRAEGRLEGRQEMREETAAAKVTTKETVRLDAIADAETAAKVRVIDTSPVPNDRT